MLCIRGARLWRTRGYVSYLERCLTDTLEGNLTTTIFPIDAQDVIIKVEGHIDSIRAYRRSPSRRYSWKRWTISYCWCHFPGKSKYNRLNVDPETMYQSSRVLLSGDTTHRPVFLVAGWRTCLPCGRPCHSDMRRITQFLVLSTCLSTTQ